MNRPEPIAVDTTRDKLRAPFKNGSLPDEVAFYALIDSFALKSELPSPPEPQPVDPLLLREGWRIGQFDPARPRALEPLPRNLLPPQGAALANGEWQTLFVLENLHNNYAFEIVACASGLVQGGRHAITHALAIATVGGGHLRQTFSAPHRRRFWWWPCWLVRPRLRVEFRWLERGAGLALQVRTSAKFGARPDGPAVAINHHITRLW